MSKYIAQNFVILKTGENSTRGFNWSFNHPPCVGDTIEIVDMNGDVLNVKVNSINYRMDFEDSLDTYRINCEIIKSPDTD